MAKRISAPKRIKKVRPEPDPENGSESRQLPGWTIEQLDYPTFRVGLLAKVMDRLTIRHLVEVDDLTYAEWRVLARLAAMPRGGTVGQVAELAWVDRAEVSRAGGALEGKGFVARRDNPSDRRTPILFLTAKGRKQYRSTIRARSAFHESLLSDLSAEERTQLDELLGRIGGRLLDLLRTDPSGHG